MALSRKAGCVYGCNFSDGVSQLADRLLLQCSFLSWIMSYPLSANEPVSLHFTANYECFVATVQPCLVLTHLPVPVPSLFLLLHANKHTCRTHSHMAFRVENKLPHILLPAQSYLKGLVASLGHTQLLCHCRAEEGSDLEEQWRRSMGRAGGGSRGQEC